MIEMKLVRFCVFVISVFFAVIAVSASGISVADPRCEYRINPLGIDVTNPRLSWKLESDVRGEQQTAFQIIVATSRKMLSEKNADLWDSGKVHSDQSIQVVYKGKPLVSGLKCWWKVRVWDKDDEVSSWSSPVSWEMALLSERDWQGKWIGDGKALPEKDEDFYKDDPAPLFRKEFNLDKKISRARLYITGLGYYEACVNGEKTGESVLDPGWTDYSRRVLYSTYDVTDNLKKGANCLGVTLGNGWYNPLPLRMWGHINIRDTLPVGRPAFIAQLNVEYTDGSFERISSDTTWQVHDGPLLRNSIYLGEVYDARRELPAWNKPGYDPVAWKSAVEVSAPAGRLQAQFQPPVRHTETIRPVALTSPAQETYIYDMGVNFSGVVRLKIKAAAGTSIKLRFGELINKDGTLNPMTSVCGQIKGKGRGGPGAPDVAWQEDTYIAKGEGIETYIPQFTWHAFRYVELTGCTRKPDLKTIEGLRYHSDVEKAGTFFCSNDLFNRIQKMVTCTFLNNIMSVQSDCPHRERFGYGGDLVVTAEAFMSNFDMAQFYAKAARDWSDAALEDGMLTDTAPFVGIQYCGVGWAMAHPHLLTQLYRYYGDKRLVEEEYAVSKRWLDLVRSQYKDHIITKGLHDHESLVKEEVPVMVTPLYYKSARMLAQLAGILGRQQESQEYEQLAADIRKAYIEKFVASGTGVAGSGIQGAQAFALFNDMVLQEDRQAALKYLISDIIDKQKGHLTTGIFGTRYMLDVLSREGEVEVVNNMVNLKDFPGWGYMLENGATTLWEHWEFSDNTFSHNHPMFGTVSQWFYNWLGGIEPAEDAVGFDRALIHPQFVDGVDWVECSCNTVRGPVTCNWKRTGNEVLLNLEVPVSTTAELFLPSGGELTEKGHSVTESRGVEKLKPLNEQQKFRLVSGSYKLVYTIN